MRGPGPLAARVAAGFSLAFSAALALAHVHPFGDQHLFAAPRSQRVELPQSIPAKARAIVAADCVDCHSSTARAPLYGRFAPVSWLLERDIAEAREHLNFAEWDGYDADRRQVLLAEIGQQAKAGHMPPAQYLLVHRSARLKQDDIAVLLGWVRTAQQTEGGAAVESASATASRSSGVHAAASSAAPVEGMLTPDATRGADLFNRRCTGCHSLTSNHEGPRLGGVYGRAAASVAGFPYSAALAGTHITWDEQTLERWLTDPDAFVPGVNMDFRVPKPQERADIIAFLKQAR
jgi:cytochrome c